MRIKFEPTGTHIRNGKLKIRLDFYPDPSYKTYAMQNIDVFARELTEEESEKENLGDGAFHFTKKAKELQKLVPTKKQLNPFLCHFISIDPDMTRGELTSYIKTNFKKNTLSQLDDILNVNNRKDELHSVLKDKLGKQEEYFGMVDMKEINSRLIGLEEVI